MFSCNTIFSYLKRLFHIFKFNLRATKLFRLWSRENIYSFAKLRPESALSRRRTPSETMTQGTATRRAVGATPGWDPGRSTTGRGDAGSGSGRIRVFLAGYGVSDSFFRNPRCSSLQYSDVCDDFFQIIRCEGISCDLVGGGGGVGVVPKLYQK